MRIGVGFDAHRLVSGRPLVLGGVNIPSELGLEGWSDADVAVHAIIDALLGAAALGDIGSHFPPNDLRYKDASSIALLTRTGELIKAQGWRVGNIDATIVAERPFLDPFSRQVSVKAKTTEGMGFAGREEGIAALAVSLLERT
jgi:2-C-methyl-D-erythritol 2,4-cyclodiphosphate synthase